MTAPTTNTAISDKEAAFAIDEIFMSRTDARGVIQYGNAVFQRVSAFDWAELIGAPHKIVRHPDMPAGVFERLWKDLKSDKATGGFVKNLSKTGEYYWVFALIMPVPDGYLSIRIKPSGKLFETARNIYADLRKAEHRDRISAPESCVHLTAILQDHGYSSYFEFLAAAIAEVTQSRQRALKRKPLAAVQVLQSILAEWNTISESSTAIAAAHKAIRTTPLNMQIQAGKLNDSGKPLAVIATNFTSLSEEMTSMMKVFTEQTFDLLQNVYKTLFFLSAASMQLEAAKEFAADAVQGEDLKRAEDRRWLQGKADGFQATAQEAIKRFDQRLAQFKDHADRVANVVAGLSMTRVMCEIEVARLSDKEPGLHRILAELDEFQDVTTQSLARIQSILKRVSNDTRKARAA